MNNNELYKLVIKAMEYQYIKQNNYKVLWKKNYSNEILFRKTKITEEQITKINNKKYEWYFKSEEALKLNIVDEIL